VVSPANNALPCCCNCPLASETPTGKRSPIAEALQAKMLRPETPVRRRPLLQIDNNADRFPDEQVHHPMIDEKILPERGHLRKAREDKALHIPDCRPP
jgi:hypothetical protein